MFDKEVKCVRKGAGTCDDASLFVADPLQDSSIIRRDARRGRSGGTFPASAVMAVCATALVDAPKENAVPEQHGMGPHRLLATSGCDIGIEFLIEIVRDRCMFGASLYVWGIFPRPDPRRGRGGSPDAREDIVAARELLISEARLARLRGLNQ